MKSDSWIKLKKSERQNVRSMAFPSQVNRQQNDPEKVCFYFSDSLLIDLQLWQESNKKIRFSKELLADFYFYVLCEHQNSFPAELNFCSFYQLEREQIAVIHSVISLQSIEQQIRYDYLQEPQLLDRIIKTHYWVIEQMLAQLKLKRAKNIPHQRKNTNGSKSKQDRQIYVWLSLVFSFFVAVILYSASINLVFILIITGLVAVFLSISMRRYLFPNSSNFVLHKLLFSKFSFLNKEKIFK